MTEWRPLFARFDEERAKEYDALHEGVPPWMAKSLLAWVIDRVPPPERNRADAREAVLKGAERVLRLSLNWSGGDAAALKSLVDQVSADEELLLTTAEYFAAQMDNTYNQSQRNCFAELDTLLKQSGSVWQVVWPPSGRPGFSRRVLPEIEAVFNLAIAQGDRAADYLRQAWQRAFGRDGNPDGAYRDAVRALEAVLKPIVSPENDVTTLGTIIGHIRAKPEKFAARLEPKAGSPVEIFAAELQMLWTAQLDRHGTNDETVPLNVSIEQARDAAVRAAAIVQIVRSGGFRLR